MKTINKIGIFVIVVLFSLLIIVVSTVPTISVSSLDLETVENNENTEIISFENLDLGDSEHIDSEEDIELLKSDENDFVEVVQNALNSVVIVKADKSQGTGFFIHPKGYIVTNEHVIRDAESIEITDYNEVDYKAKLIGIDKNLDLALLKVEGEFSYLKLANSEEVKVGERVIAIGNPKGLMFSVSEGIVSGTRRKGSNGLKAYIQTDAPLNPGNSGGPLINNEGQVIGINNFRITNSESLGFALESNYIYSGINDIINVNKQAVNEEITLTITE